MKKIMGPLVVGVVVAVMAACGAGSGYTAAGGDRNILTRDQLESINATDLYDAVQRLRPNWLTARGPASVSDDSPRGQVASVYMSGNRMGDAEVLRNIRLEDIDSLRYYDAGSAGARFGMGHPRGVIEVLPRGGGRD
jgi:hypothetical protein